MHGHAVRGLAVSSALAALTIFAAGCGGSGHPSAPTVSPTAPASGSAAAAACRKIQATLAQAPATLGKLALNPSSAHSAVTAFVAKLKNEAAAADNPALTSAVNQFTGSVQKALGSAQSNPGDIDSLISKLTKDSQKIVTACRHASG
jgi:hypothetical protein